MHSVIEDYLAEAARELHALPIARRNEELKELRGHLLEAVAVNRSDGQNDDEAAASAVGQCGPPAEAARGIVATWLRDGTLAKRSFWGALACASALSLLFYPLMGALTARVLEHSAGAAAALAAIVGQVGAGVLIGGLTGLFFPRRAVQGTFPLIVLFGVVGPGQTIFLWWRGDVSGSTQFLSTLVSVGEMFVVALTAIVFSAWAGSRWRGRRSGAASIVTRS